MTGVRTFALPISPVFYSPGNHEYWRKGLQDWQDELDRYGLRMMQNDIETITLSGIGFNILGLDESAASPGSDISVDLFETLSEMPGIGIVLAHYPENFAMLGEDSYENKDFDILFAGHAHGGQIILPFIGGLISPGEGFDPSYYKGMHEGSKVHPSGNISRMIISRGLGNSIIPQRLFNRPEIVVVGITMMCTLRRPDQQDPPDISRSPQVQHQLSHALSCRHSHLLLHE